MVEASKPAEKELHILITDLRFPQQQSVTRVNLTFKHLETQKKVPLKDQAELIIPITGKMSNLLLKFACTGSESAFSR
jgi:hypothetical protein